MPHPSGPALGSHRNTQLLSPAVSCRCGCGCGGGGGGGGDHDVLGAAASSWVAVEQRRVHSSDICFSGLVIGARPTPQLDQLLEMRVERVVPHRLTSVGVVEVPGPHAIGSSANQLRVTQVGSPSHTNPDSDRRKEVRAPILCVDVLHPAHRQRSHPALLRDPHLPRRGHFCPVSIFWQDHE
eukprot:COSAG01_NODE_2319_length_7913_cov_82.271052_12_plen_182_part_00